MSGDEGLSDLARVLSALGNITRLRIIRLVSETDRPLHIKALSRTLKVRYSAVYRHVATLRRAGIVTIHEVGRSRVVALRRRKELDDLLKIVELFAK
ncbi:MAG: winged helix-turn-helix domain-containing protein [Thaumarchaeota archaeon]|nr:winged helix-turn-helix domain-containing protein [Candidatus Calditenuaceae archaeon]MDW8041890.1 winged helix-turn-helix domain-containing protein [Nitrososphaerota archaeon]